MAGTCTVCGRRPRGSYTVSLHGELTCASHPSADRCPLCARPREIGSSVGWRPFAGSSLRCPTCVVGAVEAQADARRYLPSVRAEMASIGIRLDTPVRVVIVSADELSGVAVAAGDGVTLGVTESQRIDGRPGAEVLQIRIIAGLTPTHFGRAVAHELGHAWLAQHATAEITAQPIEEGVCELFAHAWLKRRGTALAEALRTQLRDNPDPVYGQGFRSVHAAVSRHGIDAVLHEVCAHGQLPGP